jgi:hypothetical protein
VRIVTTVSETAAFAPSPLPVVGKEYHETYLISNRKLVL